MARKLIIIFRIFPLLCIAISSLGYAMQPIVTLTSGATTSFGQQTQMLSSDSTLFKYYPNNSSGLKFIVGGFVGEEYAFNKIWAWQFGLAFYQIASTSVNGKETQAPTENPNAINFWNYHYKVLSRQLLFENKLLFTFCECYHPYLLIGLGGSLNHAYGFQVTPQNSGEVATAIFQNNRNTSFIYTLGLGFDINVLKKLRLGLGYRFVNLGNYNLGKGTLNTGVGGEIFSIPALNSNNSFNQELLIQLTYLI